MSRTARHAAIVFSLATLAACQATVDQRAVSPGDLPPIAGNYRGTILAWARDFYAEPHGLRQTAISDPLLIRDDTGRLLWLVCVEANARERNGEYMGVQRQAFGFAPDYASAPLARNRSALTREECDDPRLVYRAFPALARI